ncbi:MAG: lipase [Pseudomonadota bacterium]
MYKLRVVRSRIIVFVGGYERKSHEAFFRRLNKQAAVSAKTWDTHIEAGHVRYLDGERVASCAYYLRDPSGVSCETDFHFLDIDGWVQADNQRSAMVRLGHYLRSFADYMVSGTGFRFFATNWRFALYFLYPFSAVLLSVLAGWIVGRLAGQLVVVMGLVGGMAATILLLFFLNRRYFLLHLMDLWSFSADYIRQRRPLVRKQLDAWGAYVAQLQADHDVDEILLVGHSTGGAIILDVAASAARACRARDVEPKFTIMTVGSTSLKIGLHPAARWYADAIAELEANAHVHWFEYQSLTDLINFYRCDPFALMGVEKSRAAPFPAFQQVRMSHMLDRPFYRQIQFNLLRVHYQFISGNTQRYFYDFPIICFGALSLADRFEFEREAVGVVSKKQVGIS